MDCPVHVRSAPRVGRVRAVPVSEWSDLVRFIAGVALSLGMMLFPKRLWERLARKMLLRNFYPACSDVVFFKSGRSALSAALARIADLGGGSTVLVPDYVCNVVHRAVTRAGLRPEVYRTDDEFSADNADIESRLRRGDVAAVVLVSLFGVQNGRQSIIDRIRRAEDDAFIVLDECQNAITGLDITPDHRTLIVVSFNMKNILGVMGGAACFGENTLGLESPPRSPLRDLYLECCTLLLMLKQLWSRVARFACGLVGRRGFPDPTIEHSTCTRLHYDMAVQRIARISLVRAILGMATVARTEAARRWNHARFRDFVARSGACQIVPTGLAHVSPFVPLRSIDRRLIRGLPLKGPYATEEDPSVSLRPDLLVFENEGYSRLRFVQEDDSKTSRRAPRLSREQSTTVGRDDMQRQPARVCHISTAHKALDNRLFDKEAVSLVKAGYDVTIIAEHDKIERLQGVKIVPLPSARNRLARFMVGVSRLLNLALREDAAVYHFHDPELILVGLVLKLRGKRVIYDVHENYRADILEKEWIPKMLRRPASWAFGVLEDFASRLFDYLLVADSDVRTRFPKAKTEMITNVPPLSFSQTNGKKEDDGTLHILYSGAAEKELGIYEMLEALTLVKNRRVRLHVVGSEVSPELAARFHADPRISYHGRLPWLEYRALLGVVDAGHLLYLPTPRNVCSTGEGITKLFEFMAAGVAVLYSDIPNLRKLMDPLAAGLAVDPTSPKKIAEAIDYLCENPSMRRAMGERGREAVRDRYNWEHEERKLLAVYEEVLSD